MIFGQKKVEPLVTEKTPEQVHIDERTEAVRRKVQAAQAQLARLFDHRAK